MWMWMWMYAYTHIYLSISIVHTLCTIEVCMCVYCLCFWNVICRRLIRTIWQMHTHIFLLYSTLVLLFSFSFANENEFPIDLTWLNIIFLTHKKSCFSVKKFCSLIDASIQCVHSRRKKHFQKLNRKQSIRLSTIHTKMWIQRHLLMVAAKRIRKKTKQNSLVCFVSFFFLNLWFCSISV